LTSSHLGLILLPISGYADHLSREEKMKARQKSVQVKLDSTAVAILKALVLQIKQAENQQRASRCNKNSIQSEAGQLSLHLELEEGEAED
jgi:hypothetical protein